jgi:hypothetical protein
MRSGSASSGTQPVHTELLCERATRGYTRFKKTISGEPGHTRDRHTNLTNTRGTWRADPEGISFLRTPTSPPFSVLSRLLFVAGTLAPSVELWTQA